MGILGLRQKITFYHGDGLHILAAHVDRPDAVFFLDPPYSAGGKRAGTRLYTHNELSHEELFRLAAMLRGEVLLTYDDAPEVRALAHQHGFDVQPIAMKNTHHAQLTELLIGRSLGWAR
jgi:DNA adenine methylase